MHIITDTWEEHNYPFKLSFKNTIKEAEYEALLVGLTIVKSLGDTKVEVTSNSQVVFNQVLGEFPTKGKKLKKYL